MQLLFTVTILKFLPHLKAKQLPGKTHGRITSSGLLKTSTVIILKSDNGLCVGCGKVSLDIAIMVPPAYDAA